MDDCVPRLVLENASPLCFFLFDEIKQHEIYPKVVNEKNFFWNTIFLYKTQIA